MKFFVRLSLSNIVLETMLVMPGFSFSTKLPSALSWSLMMTLSMYDSAWRFYSATNSGSLRSKDGVQVSGILMSKAAFIFIPFLDRIFAALDLQAPVVVP